jgi:hypothetical protein
MGSIHLAREASTRRLTNQPASANLLGPQAFEQESRPGCDAAGFGNASFVEQAVDFWSHSLLERATEEGANGFQLQWHRAQIRGKQRYASTVSRQKEKKSRSATSRQLQHRRSSVLY